MSQPRTPPRRTHQYEHDAVHPNAQSLRTLSVAPVADINPQSPSSDGQDLSQMPLTNAILKSHNTIQPGLLLSTKFGVVQSDAANAGAEGPEYKYLESAGNDLPVFLSDVQSLADLKSFQHEHLGNTYRYHGLSMVDVLCYSIQSLDPEDSGNYVGLLDCSTQDQWDMAVRLVNAIYHQASDCTSPDLCDFCTTPPLLVICFTQEKWEQALKSKNLDHNSTELIYLDGYNEAYALRLRNADRTKYQLHMKQCGLAYHQCELTGLTSLCTPPRGYAPRVPQSTVKRQAEQAPVGPKRRGRPPRAFTSAKPQTKPSGKGKSTPRRLIVQDRPPLRKATSEDFLKATIKPEGTQMKEEHHCITICKGETMVEIQTDKRGKTVMRCPNCAAARRNCYWKEPDKGIDNYDKAFEFYNGTRVPGNTREGRAQRALRRMNAEERIETVSEGVEDGDGREGAGKGVGDEASYVDDAAGDDSDGDDRKVQDDVSERTDGELEWDEEDDFGWETDDADDELEEDVKDKGGDHGSGTGEDEEARGAEY
ncbi:hypothetical protein LTR24_007284 [Lithohypha guttulata]|uniref:Uncharacterized protein n=1 Tax=Lithohypha guttulata TaxID=1690604 RepID=A0ABR0K3C2_9EURO|nr:hypothetical protein LTR24_007284 [Lithohypha guttulata]